MTVHTDVLIFFALRRLVGHVRRGGGEMGDKSSCASPRKSCGHLYKWIRGACSKW